MIKIIHKNYNSKIIIIFVHGFMGGEDTWMKGDKQKPFINFLLKDIKIKNNFDVGVFIYKTQLLKIFPKTRNFFNKYIFKKKTLVNSSIDELGKLLETSIQYYCKTYENIILVSHSMGGLVSKRFVLNDLRNVEKSKICLYVSLATPHSGSDMALIGSKLIENCQLSDMTPLSLSINKLNNEWVQCDNLPKRLYAQGNSDKIVSKNSSIALDRDNQKVIYTDNDHFSIINPVSENDIMVVALKSELKDFLTIKLARSKEEGRSLALKLKDNIMKLKELNNIEYIQFKNIIEEETIIEDLELYFHFERKRGNISVLENLVKERNIIGKLDKYLN